MPIYISIPVGLVIGFSAVQALRQEINGKHISAGFFAGIAVVGLFSVIF